MNMKLTDFEETKEAVIEHARAMNRKPERKKMEYEENSMLNNYFRQERSDRGRISDDIQ